MNEKEKTEDHRDGSLIAWIFAPIFAIFQIYSESWDDVGWILGICLVIAVVFLLVIFF